MLTEQPIQYKDGVGRSWRNNREDFGPFGVGINQDKIRHSVDWTSKIDMKSGPGKLRRLPWDWYLMWWIFSGLLTSRTVTNKVVDMAIHTGPVSITSSNCLHSANAWMACVELAEHNMSKLIWDHNS